MGDYQNENKTAALLASLLAAMGGGASDGGAFTPGTTAVTIVGGEVDDTSTATLTEGNAGAARLTPYRALHVNLRDSAGNEVPVPLSSLVREVKTDTSGNSTAFSTFGATASQRNHVTAVTIANSSASTFCTVDLRDGTAGSVIWTFPVPASGGVTMNFDPPLRQPTVNTALAFDPSAAVSTITISVNGFQSAA